MNFESFKIKILEALAQIGLDVKDKADNSIFTNTKPGLVPAPNITGETSYSISPGFPKEGDILIVGQNVTLTSIVSTVGYEKILKSTGWENHQSTDISNKLDKTSGIQSLLAMTENEYNNLESKSSTTIYFLTDD